MLFCHCSATRTHKHARVGNCISVLRQVKTAKAPSAAARALGDAAKAKAAADAADAAHAEGQNADDTGTDHDVDTETHPAPSTPVKAPQEERRATRNSPAKLADVGSPKPAPDAKRSTRTTGVVDTTRVQTEEPSLGRGPNKRRK